MENPALLGGEPACRTAFPRWPVWAGEEERRLTEALESGFWGLYSTSIDEWEERFAEIQKARYATSVSNGTISLTVALRAKGVGHGDEVIVPPYTFLATAAAVLWTGAIPVFADIDPGSLNLDPESASSAVTEKTKAIIPVHIAGCPCDMDAFRNLADEHGLALIEDAAQAHGACWNGKGAGTIGDAGSFSFQSSKNLPSGEGGMLVTDDKEMWERCIQTKNCGRPPKGAEFEFETLGTNARISAFQAAVSLAQLEGFEERFQRREKNWTCLSEALREIPGLELQARDPKIDRHALHLLILRYDSEAFSGLPRSRFIEALAAEGVEAPHGGYQPIYENPGFLADASDILRGVHVPNYADLSLPNTEKVCKETAVWIRQNALLGETTSIVEEIAEAIRKIHRAAKELR